MDIKYGVGRVNSYTTGDQAGTAGFGLADGGWVVLWHSYLQDGSLYGVYQKRFSANGMPLSGDVLVNTTTTTSECRPNGAPLADGGWVVCWEEQNNPIIFQQRYDKNGLRVGVEIQLTADADTSQNASVAGLRDGGWVVTWSGSLSSNTTGTDIFQQRYDREGIATGTITQVNTTTVDHQTIDNSSRQIVGLTDGGWLISWTSNLQDGNGAGIYFQRFDVDGAPVGAETQVNEFINSNQNQPCVDACQDGGWIIVWTSYAQINSTDVYQRRYDASGNATGSESPVNTTTSGTQQNASVCVLVDHGWVVSYESGGDVYQQRFDAAGVKVGGEILVNAYQTNTQGNPWCQALKDGGWVISYYSSGQDGSSWGTYQQRYNAHGEVASDSHASLHRVADMQLCMQRYGIDHEKALILCNTDISETVYNNEPSQFDRLFNTPPLNGFVFTPDGVQLDLTPGAADDPRKATLRRAFHADDVSLYRLLLIADPTATDGLMRNDITHQTDLYLACLLAEVHALSVDELALLLEALGESASSLSLMSDEELRRLTDRLRRTLAWLQARKWRVSDLFVMTTTGYPTTLTPDIQNFLDALNGGLNGTTATGDALITEMAPYAAAALRLTSGEVAQSLLHWMDRLQPVGINVDAFWALIKDNTPPTDVAIQFCHALAQLAVIYRAVSLDARSLALLVSTPLRLVSETVTVGGIAVAGHDADTLRQLTDYTDWLGSLEDDADGTLTLLSVPGPVVLPPAEVARAMGRDEQLLTDAAAQALSHTQIADAATLASWPEIAVTLQWVALADLLGISPERVNAWLALDYLDKNASAGVLPVPIPYADWSAVAGTLTAGLDANQATPLENHLEASLSAALVGYYLYEVADATLNLKSRDDLYQYLLIDNQVSAEIITTRIAEAMASVQLYVGRALDQVEPEVDSAVLSRPFFTDWSTYNKRYSTWAGVSQLVYYPENYIDPTVRHGQTGMMDTLLQTISQSSLTTDIVEEAFNNYLTSFEQVANLDIISGYHDDVNVSQGLTYFLARNPASETEYYWRSVNHNLFQNGSFPANAWSEWLSVSCGVIPFNGHIRPVVYNSRLHLAWLESAEQAETNETGGVNTTLAYYLKLSYLKYDGSWSPPLNYDVTHLINESSTPDLSTLGFYCAESPDDATLQFLFYQVSETPSSVAPKGLYILGDFSLVEMEAGRAQTLYGSVFEQLDKPVCRRINNRYIASSYSIPPSILASESFTWGTQGLTRIYGGNISEITHTSTTSTLNITCDAIVDVKFDVTSAVNERAYKHLITLQHGFTPGSVVRLNTDNYPYYGPIDTGDSTDLRLYSFAHHNGNLIVRGRRGTASGSNPPKSKNYYGVGFYVLPTPPTENNHVYTGTEESDEYYVKGGEVYITWGEWMNTNILPADVMLKVTIGDVEQHFTADIYVSDLPAPSLSRMTYSFNDVVIDASGLEFIDNKAEVLVSCEAYFADGLRVGSETFVIPVTAVDENNGDVLSLFQETAGVQFMQMGPYRVRMNTLFARQLVERAVKGINTILSLSTQNLPEPNMGYGGHITVTLPSYNEAEHGTNRSAFIKMRSGDADSDTFVFENVSLLDTEQQIILFVPVSQTSLGNTLNFPAALEKGLGMVLSCQRAELYAGQLQIDATSYAPKLFVKDASWLAGRDMDVQILPGHVDPMDFGGANALYFWELFYYTSMLVAQRLLTEQNFDEAQRWLEYVWNPAGYIVNGQLQAYQWNVRPLLEDTSWNSEPLESTDPDAVAQYDPMHYKMSTFMRTLDLLLARGDAAYRRLERDTLNEAKMWYMQAQYLLGAEPYVPLEDDVWSDPSLDTAADQTGQNQREQMLMSLRQGQVPDTLTANTLTGLFLPQANGVMLGYWQTLAQRLYNLRHNLSIDGQPLSLPVYATPADPAALHSAAVSSSQGGSPLPAAYLSTWRYRQVRDGAVSAVGQLIQFGATLQGIFERQDGEALSHLLNTQGSELMLISLGMQDKTISELASEREALVHARSSAQLRYNRYSKLYDENISSAEADVMELLMGAAILTSSSATAKLASSVANSFPNIYGLAMGGSVRGAMLEASSFGSKVGADAMNITATKTGKSEEYRRRRSEWLHQRDYATNEINQIDAQLAALDLRSEGALQQKTYLETQQQHLQLQLEFLTTKFTSQALYSWLSGRLSAIFYQLYDLTVSRCLMVEASYHQETGETTRFIKPGAWQSTYAGLSCGETLLLNMTQMEDAYLRWEQRALEVSRTVSLSDFYNGRPADEAFDLATEVAGMVSGTGTDSVGTSPNSLSIDTNDILSASFRLSDLNIAADYPDALSLGNTRRIKQVSVSLPALVGPYQNVQAVLSYGGTAPLSRGCNLLAVSHGMNDSGQFQLDFSDGQYLPFEGIQITDGGTLTLRFPNARDKQQEMLLTLSDMIVHFNYTIR
ncbi:TPA: toxin [Klebsiella aerogenes]|nr:toxin [Klebsiella aerogenes]